jgi:hypothetical protein
MQRRKNDILSRKSGSEMKFQAEMATTVPYYKFSGSVRKQNIWVFFGLNSEGCNAH